MASFHSQRGFRKPYSRPSRGDVDGQWVHDMAPTGPKALMNDTGKQRRTPIVGVTEINNKLVVSNLHYEITPKDLTAIFGQIGTLISEPRIRYDRSGRSTGVAIITYETAAEAIRAKKQYDGILAKGTNHFIHSSIIPLNVLLMPFLGQPMSIAVDTSTLRQPRRAVSAPTTSSLLNRIQKPPLLDRLSRDDLQIKKSSGPRNGGGVGPIRSRGPRGPAVRNAPKKPKTAEELDKELDTFMGDSTEATAPAAPAPDVEMA